MNENELLLINSLKMLVVLVCMILYRLGGQYDKALRRYVMPFVYIFCCYGFSIWKGVFNPWMFLTLPLLVGSLCMGYGADNFWQKIKRRAIYGLLLALSFLPFAFVFDRWVLFVCNCVLCVCVSVVLGVANPLKEAVGEEMLIALFSLTIPIFMI